MKDVYELLKKYKIPVAKAVLLKNLSELKQEIKYPAVFKINSPDILHKTDVGCVEKVFSKADAKSAFVRIMNSAKKHTNNINGIIAQEMLEGLEVILGAKYDEQFGPIILFGSGGIFTEIFKDITIRLLPVNKREIRDMIFDTKISSIFSGYRGISVDIKMLIGTIMNFSRLFLSNTKIKEIEINPLFVNGKNIIAADVRTIYYN